MGVKSGQKSVDFCQRLIFGNGKQAFLFGGLSDLGYTAGRRSRGRFGVNLLHISLFFS